MARLTTIPVLILLLAAPGLLPAAATAADATEAPAPPTFDATDAALLGAAMRGSITEIALSRTALTHGLPGPEREFAQRMVDDIGAVEDGLEIMANIRGVGVPNGPDAQAQAIIDHLDKLDEQHFAKAYFAVEAASRKQALALFTDISERARNEELKGFAARSLAHFQSYSDQATGLSTSL